MYGLGVIDGHRGPSVVQVPDFGSRFWVYQGVDQRTDSFIRLGAMYGTKPGLYLLAPQSWDGAVPAGITGVFRFDTRIAICIPRLFMDDTDADRAAIQDVINQVMLYPLDQYTGEPQTTDWSKAPVFPAGMPPGRARDPVGGPGRVLRATAEVMAEIPAQPGEEAWYEWLGSVLHAANEDAQVAAMLRSAAADADTQLVSELFQFRNIGLPLPGHWSTHQPEETTYFYQDLDEHGDRLHGSRSYTITFPAGTPPVQRFWSLTLYNEHHFFHPNDLKRYSLGTKNKNLHYAADGSLTLTASATPPDNEDLRSNWLPAPDGPFSLYLRA